MLRPAPISLDAAMVEHARAWAVALLAGVARRLEALPAAELPDVLREIGGALGDLEDRVRPC